jgi:2-dehydropantoate 2-reductase
MFDVALIGPGAIGCAVGAAVVDVGGSLVVAARTPFDRLVVSHPGGVVDCEVDVRVSADGLGPAPLVLLATKTYDTSAASPWLEALCGRDTVVAVLQNGVTHVDRVQPLVGEAEVLPVVVELPAVRSAPGVVTLSTPLRLMVPEGSAGEAFATAMGDSFITVQPVDDWITRAWSKLALNAASAVAVLARRSNSVYADAEAAELRLRLLEETAAVGRAVGASLAPDFAERMAAYLAGTVAAGHTPSIVVDRLAGAPTEWRDRNAVVVELADEHGLDVPVSRMVTTLLRLGEPEV